MKSLKFILLLLGSSFLFNSCIKDRCEYKARLFFPIYKTRDAVLQGLKLLAPTSIGQAGKIFSYSNFIFINEVDKGIHVIDNTNPASPNKIGFINIEGNLDLWVNKNLLYADCYDNLLVIDISDIHNIKLVETLPKVFPERWYNGAAIDETKGYVIGWMQRDTTITVDCKTQNNVPSVGAMLSSNSAAYAVDLSSSGGSSFLPPSGVAGSLTRFNLTGNYLYCVDNTNIHAFNISVQKPVKTSDVSVGWGMETIFSFNNNLFLGTTTGVLIYSLSDPSKPAYLNQMQHLRNCDPVITDGDYAFVTLRSGSRCGGNGNQLDVLNVKDVLNVSVVKSYILTNPYGLGMDNKYVFVCDDGYGIRVYDRKDVTQMNELKKIEVDHPRDIIVLNNSLFVITDTKMYEFDYSDINNIKQISQIN